MAIRLILSAILFAAGWAITVGFDCPAVAAPKEQQFEAQIRHPNGYQAKVRIEARDHHDAKMQMIARYCAGDDRCLLEGPWLYHGSR